MKPSKAQLSTAQRIYDRLGRGSVADIDAIAAALVAAHQDGIREGKRQAAEIARDLPSCELTSVSPSLGTTLKMAFGVGADAQRAAIERAILSTITDESEGTLCSDCPRVGYPTDVTRCGPCPRRRSETSEAE